MDGQILDEVFAALLRNRPDLDPAKLDRTRTLMGSAVRDWKITGADASFLRSMADRPVGHVPSLAWEGDG